MLTLGRARIGKRGKRPNERQSNDLEGSRETWGRTSPLKRIKAKPRKFESTFSGYLQRTGTGRQKKRLDRFLLSK
jgi:hypothetical protein